MIVADIATAHQAPHIVLVRGSSGGGRSSGFSSSRSYSSGSRSSYSSTRSSSSTSKSTTSKPSTSKSTSTGYKSTTSSTSKTSSYKSTRNTSPITRSNLSARTTQAQRNSVVHNYYGGYYGFNSFFHPFGWGMYGGNFWMWMYLFDHQTYVQNQQIAQASGVVAPQHDEFWQDFVFVIIALILLGGLTWGLWVIFHHLRIRWY